jgi:phosphotransferase system  glucose/maltose/N-acetylglucosamine-specific IIC component
MTIMLIYSPSCPHCHTYMPMWNEMCGLKQRRANMVSMEASTYDETPMAKSQPVTGVPTVLFVDKQGRVTEAREPRNREVMATAVSRGVTEEEATAANAVAPESQVSLPSSASTVSETQSNGTVIAPNPLEALPAQPVPSESVAAPPAVQYGGNPWAAFLATAAQAAPAAVLAGAYAISKARRRTVRSSGLPAPEHSAKWRRLRARLSRRR